MLLECKIKLFITTLDTNAALDKKGINGTLSKLIRPRPKVNFCIIRLLLTWYSNLVLK